MIHIDEMLIELAAHCAQPYTTERNAGFDIFNDGNFFLRLKKGGDCLTGNYAKAMDWFAAPRWSPVRVSTAKINHLKKLRANGKPVSAAEFATLIGIKIRSDGLGPAGVKILTELLRYGLVNREKRGDKNGRKRWVYFVSPDGQRAIEAALTVRRKGRTP